MVVRALKRKLHQDVVLLEASLDTQLQSVLDISLDKFRRDQTGAEPSLRRSVLITNTLRHAKTHMEACLENGNRNPAKRAEPRLPPPTPSRREPAGFEDVEDQFTEDFSLTGTIQAILRELDSA